MARNKIGFHVGPGGNMTGIGNYYKELDGSKIPFVIKSVDNYGPIHEATSYNGASHILVFRLSTQGQGTYNFDVPDYNKAPKDAAIEHWNETVKKLPKEFNKQKVWLEVINEVDKDKSSWLGHFATEISQIATLNGYKIALFGWSSGEPEPSDWLTDGMKRFLQYASTRQNNVAVALHEYSYTIHDIFYASPYLVGRFQFLFDACKQLGIANPTVLITEWGWEYANVPAPPIALEHIDRVAEIYAKHPEIKGAALWYLGAGFGDIANKANPLIAPVTSYTRLKVFPDPDIPSPPSPPPTDENKSLSEVLWGESLTRQLLSLNPKASLQSRIFADGFTPVTTEWRTNYRGVIYAAQAAENVKTGARRVYYATVPFWDKVSFIMGGNPTPPPPNPSPSPNPNPNKIDLLPYIMGGNNKQYEMQYTWGGGGTHPVHVQHEGTVFYIVKGDSGEYEELYYDNNYIYRGIDTSEAPDKFYVQKTSGQHGAIWCPRFMSIGEKTIKTLTVEHYFKSGCVPRLSSNVVDSLTLTNKFDVKILDGGLQFSDVIRLEWNKGEGYLFARDFGLIGFEFTGGKSYVVAIHNNNRPLKRNEINCYKIGNRFYKK